MKNAVQLIAALALAGCVAVGNREVTASLPPQPGPEQIVAARQAAFHMIGAAMGNMKAAIDQGRDVAGQAYAARGVARWARALPSMFPDSARAVTPTRARPEIFANRADFEAKAAALAAAAERLAEVARSGDREAFAAQHRATAATCAACHELYQAPQAPAQR
ncbi:MAG TPA: cytochrome c [Allosphingosinicella sp.]|jgi:cytochrome c556